MVSMTKVAKFQKYVVLILIVLVFIALSQLAVAFDRLDVYEQDLKQKVSQADMDDWVLDNTELLARLKDSGLVESNIAKPTLV